MADDDKDIELLLAFWHEEERSQHKFLINTVAAATLAQHSVDMIRRSNIHKTHTGRAAGLIPACEICLRGLQTTSRTTPLYGKCDLLRRFRVLRSLFTNFATILFISVLTYGNNDVIHPESSAQGPELGL